MKKIISVLIFSISFCIIAAGQMKDADAVVKELFEVLKTKDEIRYAKFFPDYKTIKRVMIELLTPPTERGEKDSFMADNFTKNVYAEELEEASKKFHNFLSEGETKKIVWSNIILKGFMTDTVINKSGENDELKFTLMQGTINLLSGNKEYTVKFKGTVWSENDNRRYKAEFKQVFEKGNEPPNDDEFSVMDSIPLGADTTVPILSTIPDTLRQVDYKPVKPKKLPVKKAPVKKPAAKSAALKPKQ